MHQPATVISDSLADRICRDLELFGLVPADDADVAPAHELAGRLIGGMIVSADDLRRVHRRSRAALFIAREEGEIAGILAFVLLNAAGLQAVQAGRFDAVEPASRHVATPGEPVCALYGWGVAAASKTAAQRLIEGARVMGRSSAAHLPYFARPTTAAGERLMRERLNFVDYPGSRDGLVWTPPFNQQSAAA